MSVAERLQKCGCMSDFAPAPKQTAQNFTVDPSTLPPLPAEFFEAMNEPAAKPKQTAQNFTVDPKTLPPLPAEFLDGGDAPKQTAENFTVDPATLAPLPFFELY